MALFGGAERRGPGVVRYAGRVWAACRARKAGICWLTGAAFQKGDAIYRPLTNDSERMRRVRADTWDRDPLVVHKEVADARHAA